VEATVWDYHVLHACADLVVTLDMAKRVAAVSINGMGPEELKMTQKSTFTSS
jgi:hypothetical protein